MLLSWTLAAHANLVLDQSNPGPLAGSVATGVNSFGVDIALGQVFEVGTTGTLARVELDLVLRDAPNQLLDFDIRPTVAGVPQFGDAPTLASVSLDLSPFSGSFESRNVAVDLSAFNLAVDVGDQLAIVLRSDNIISGTGSTGTYAWEQSNGTDQYANGAAYIRRDADPWVVINNSSPDFGFRTFVAVIPEANAVLAWSALSILGLAFRNRAR